MNLKNLIPFFPPLFGIYLIWISYFTKFYLSSRVDRFVDVQSRLPPDQDYLDYLSQKGLVINDLRESGLFNQSKLLLEYFALGWATLIGFINAAFSTIVSLLTIFSSNSTGVGTVTIIIVLFIFIPGFWWVFSLDIDELVSAKTTFGNMTTAKICQIILTVFNIFLIIAIAISQTSS